MRPTLKVFLCALLVGALAIPALAQTSTATIRGKVTNDQGKALGNAKVTAVGTASGFGGKRTATETLRPSLAAWR